MLFRVIEVGRNGDIRDLYICINNNTYNYNSNDDSHDNINNDESDSENNHDSDNNDNKNDNCIEKCKSNTIKFYIPFDRGNNPKYFPVSTVTSTSLSSPAITTH